MNKQVDSYITRGLIIAGAIFLALNLSSCAPKKEVMAMEPEPPMEEEVPEEVVELIVADDIYVVVSGDSLWAITGSVSIYNNALRWPLIYANNDQIEHADLIFPGQELAIRRDLSRDDINAAVEHAKNRGVRMFGELLAYDSSYRKSTMMMEQ